MFEVFTSQFYNTAVLTLVLYLIHRSFHKVNFLGFVMIGAVLITLSNYMVSAMHVNQPTAMLIVIIGYPVFSYLVASTIKGTRKKVAETPFVMVPQGPFYPPRY